MKYYVTRYALTRGIEEVEGEKCGRKGDKVLIKSGNYWNWSTVMDLGKDIFTNLKDARKKAEKMRFDKVAGLQKQINRIEEMKF